MTHLFDLGKPFFVAGQFGHEGLVLHPFPVQLLSFISSSIPSCQHPIGLWELCSAIPHTHMHRAVSRQLRHRHTLSQSFSHHLHTQTHTALGPIHSIAIQHCSTTKNLFASTTNTHTLPKNLQSRGESSTSAECAAAVGSGAQGWEIHWVFMSSRLASRPLQFCCSIRASVQRLRKNNRYARTRKTDTHESVQSPRESSVAMTPAVFCKKTLHYNPSGDMRTKRRVFACLYTSTSGRSSGFSAASGIVTPSCCRPGWMGGLGEEWEESPMCVDVGGGGVADLDT